MHPLQQYPILRTLLRPFRRSQQKTLAWVIAAIAEVAQARSTHLALYLATRLGIQVGSALNRLYRLLRNPRWDERKLTEGLLRVLQGAQERLWIALDGTGWPHHLQLLVASVIVGRRASPVQTKAVEIPKISQSQNSSEESFLEELVKILRRRKIQAVFLCDRGFRRVGWMRRLLELQQSFVVRLVDQVMVFRKGRKRLLKQWHLGYGQAVDLGWVELREDRAVRVRVVGVWARGQKEPWWLATDQGVSMEELVAWYDRRMGIEEQFRDTKGCRFGVQLEWTQFRKPRY